MASSDPYRDYLTEEDINNTQWNFGPPNYDVVNKLFEQGRTYVWPVGTAEEKVQRLVKTFEMELVHKANPDQFKTVDPNKFTISINGRKPLNLVEVKEIGGSYNVFLQTSLPEDLQIYVPSTESADSSKQVFETTFARGFAFEILEVYAGPPKITYKFINQTSTMAKTMKSTAVLPEDIVVDILVQLPVKSLHRFKCVCKSWYNLIQTPDFISMHFNYTSYSSKRSSKEDSIVLIKRALVSNSDIRKYSSVFSFHSNDKILRNLAPICEIPHFDSNFSEVLGPCNGIVCITDYSRIVLCNPATREFKLLPPGLYGSLVSSFWYPKGVGFGTDSDSVDSDFKVVRIVRIIRDTSYRAEIYSLRANSWRQLDDVLPYVEYCPCFEIFFNGACHWYASHVKCIILTFKVCEEVFAEIDIPSNYLPMRGQRECLQVLNGSLAFVAYTNYATRSWSALQSIDIWVMNDYGVAESWIKLFHIGPTLGIQLPLSIWMDSFLFLENVDGQLELCELDSPHRQKFMISGAHECMRFLVYRETLISVNK